ncbi:MT-A70-domain-containing protein [Kalaharituber pfeilii]|nr:MT-A70-domain-containing protein [Kalaharituber pfeilii]
MDFNQHNSPHGPVLFLSSDRSVVLIDIPTSIAGSCPLKLLSVEPPSTPYALPEPKDPTLVFNQELLDIHNGLREALVAALQKVRHEHKGPWYLERQVGALQAHGPLFPSDLKSNLNLLQTASDDPLDVSECPDTTLHIADIYQCIVQNNSAKYNTITIACSAEEHKKFILPPRSSFLLAPFQTSVNTFLAHASRIGRFNFVLLDPPWPNRSAERCRSTYDILFNHKDLLLLPIESALREDAVVGVWVTNKPKWRHFVLERLFPKFGVEFAGEWIWLKVTPSGEPIFDLESVMRKPYEVLLFGRKPSKSAAAEHKWRRGNSGTRLPSPNLDTHSGDIKVRPIPKKVIIAVPDLHSRKPCIKDLIRPLMPTNFTACEIFGRHLVEEWFTWGEEGIKFNSSEYLVNP